MIREAVQMALEALESVTGHFTRTPSTLRDSEVRGEAHKAITVLRQALVDADDTSQERVDETTKQEHEPVAWRSTSPDGKLSNKFACKPTEGNWVEPLYTAPPKREWVGLTAYEIQEIYSGNQHWGNFACAIEAKLKEKNT